MILFLFSDDSPGNTSAIIGGVLGGLFGSIALVLILVFLLVIAMRKTRQKKIGECLCMCHSAPLEMCFCMESFLANEVLMDNSHDEIEVILH